MSRITFDEQTIAPSTPATGKVTIYPKTDGKMYSKDDAGAETLMSTGGGDVVGPASSTDSVLARFDGATGKLLKNSAAAATDAEINHLSGVTSNIQTQINGKLPDAVVPIVKGGTNSSAALSNNRVMQSSAGAIIEAAAITAARALISDANGIPVHSAVTSTELGFLSGVTGTIQSRFSIVSVSGDVTLTANAIHLVSSAAARNLTLPAHVAGQRLYVKDSTGDCETNNFTLIRTGGGNIDGIADSRILQANWGSWHLVDDGTNWFIIG